MISAASPSLGLIPTYPSIGNHPKPKRVHRPRSSLVFSKLNGASDLNTSALMTQEGKTRCDCYDMYKELVPYAKAWSWQKSIVEEKKTLIERNEACSDTLIILQHRPVYTLGTGSSEEYLNFDPKDAPFDVYRTERGGEVTYHGPGQLVIYPIINLRNHKMDLHWYLRALEEVVIRAFMSTFSVKASRLDGLTGVWVGDRKLAAIGIRASQWVTYHGLALNVTTDLTPFKQIVPCGIRDRQVGSIKELLRERFSYNRLGAKDTSYADDEALIDVTHKSLIKEFCYVFQVELCHKPITYLEFPGAKASVINLANLI